MERTLPNGFHDAYITAIAFDIIGKSVAFSLSVDVSDHRSEREYGAPQYRTGILTASNVELFFVEQPDASYNYQLGGMGVSASGDDQLNGLDTKVEELVAQLDNGTDRYRFFLNDWNSFIYIAAKDVAFSWVQPS